MKKERKELLEKYLPRWAVLPLLTILAVNSLVYWGGGNLAAGWHHYDFTFAFDRAVPLIPEFVWIYILAFPFWAAGYILAARRGKDIFYRFVATDLTIHLCCLAVFLLIPTTNVRPVLAGNTVSEKMLQFVYAVDGGGAPSNLFPSIHCYVSWLCYRGMKGAKEIPVWYQRFSLAAAVLIIISTQVLKQHYIIDAAAGVVLVELAWRFFQKGEHHRRLMGFFEKWNDKIWSKINKK